MANFFRFKKLPKNSLPNQAGNRRAHFHLRTALQNQYRHVRRRLDGRIIASSGESETIQKLNQRNIADYCTTMTKFWVAAPIRSVLVESTFSLPQVSVFSSRVRTFRSMRAATTTSTWPATSGVPESMPVA